ncbi:putative serine protease K12H4.7 [Nilaparvata lugens]|uniref:putative serine protease K12H4.7 n=1 Tax=Nilaparvata lugens TaxID=108931 RepID=UPI00193CB5B4|nr:putative serine protease K12H4.7 [Nilaparvata lugens]
MKIISSALIVLLNVHIQTSLAVFIPRTLEREAPDPIKPASKERKAQWFDQKLDHFDKSNTKTWKQRYYYNADWFLAQNGTDSGGDQLPLFIKIGGEAGIQGGWVNGGFWVSFGIDYRALFIYVEHRFYGESHPTNDMSDKNLKYLSSRQALADLDYFIDGMMKKFGMTDKSKVVVFGGSYSGALSAWVRLKYSNKVFIAHASSAPVEAIVDFTGYNKVSYKSLAAWDPQCAKTVQSVAKKEEQMMKTNEGLANLRKIFGTCVKLTTDNPLDVQSFAQFQVAVIGNIIQYNGTGNAQNIPDICNAVSGAADDDDAMQKFADFLKATVRAKYNSTCTGSRFSANVATLKNTTFGKEGSRQWTWQTCSEFGYFQSASDEDNLFANILPVSFYEEECKGVFGDKFTPEYIQQKVGETNKYYGGKDYKQSQTMFTQGSVDQWQDRGITESNEQQGYKAVYIDNASHCQDESQDSANDSPGLTAARKEMREILKGWMTSWNFKELLEQQQNQ